MTKRTFSLLFSSSHKLPTWIQLIIASKPRRNLHTRFEQNLNPIGAVFADKNALASFVVQAIVQLRVFEPEATGARHDVRAGVRLDGGFAVLANDVRAQTALSVRRMWEDGYSVAADGHAAAELKTVGWRSE